jgi:hypothetical protein
MDDFEQKLAARRLAQPSAELDRRVDDAFRAARGAAHPARKFAGWWWLAAATAFGGAAALVLVSTRQPTRVVVSVPVVYRVEAQGQVREMLLNPETEPEQPPPFTVSADTP